MIFIIFLFLCGIHFYLVGSLNELNFELLAATADSALNSHAWIYFLADHGKFVFGMAFFAFLLNFAREIVKDIQDVSGDKVIHAHTLPILIGAKKSAIVASLILLVVPITFLLLYFFNVRFIFEDIIFFIPFILAVLLAGIISLILLYLQKSLTILLVLR